MGGSLIENVASWLETQGYPLEMEIASIAQGRGFDVSQSDYYQDPEENKYREIDLVLSLSKFSNRFHLSYNILVECKSGKDKPWLLLSTQNYLKGTETLPTGDPQLRRFTVYGAFIGNDLGQDVLLRATHDQLDNIFPRLSMEDILGYGITQAFAKGNEVPFEGLISATKAAFSYAKRLGGVGLSIPCAFTIPVLVIDAPLLSVVYAPGSDKLLITQIDRGALLWKHVVAGHSRIGVYVVHRSYAKAFLGECFKSAQWWTQFPDSLLNEAYENRRERESRP